jgi:hypothetical protein
MDELVTNVSKGGFCAGFGGRSTEDKKARTLFSFFLKIEQKGPSFLLAVDVVRRDCRSGSLKIQVRPKELRWKREVYKFADPLPERYAMAAPRQRV